MTERVAGKRGRLPARHEPGLFVHQFIADDLDPLGSEASVDVTRGITDWLMLGNGPDPTCTVPGFNPEGVGDCFWVALESARRIQAWTGAGFEPTFHQAHANWTVADNYFAYGRWAGLGGEYPDQGTVMAEGLQFARAKGHVKRYGEVDLSQPNALTFCDQLMAEGYAILLGVSLCVNYSQEFADGQPWDTGPGNPIDPNEGHAVLKVKSGPSGGTVISWTHEQGLTSAFEAAGIEEVWAVQTTEAADNPKFDSVTWDSVLDALPNYHGPID